jgi:hypothetical protein
LTAHEAARGQPREWQLPNARRRFQEPVIANRKFTIQRDNKETFPELNQYWAAKTP